MNENQPSVRVGEFSDKVFDLCGAVVRHNQSAWTDAQREWWVAAALNAKIAADDMVLRNRELQKRQRELLVTIEILERKLAAAAATSLADKAE